MDICTAAFVNRAVPMGEDFPVLLSLMQVGALARLRVLATRNMLTRMLEWISQLRMAPG